MDKQLHKCLIGYFASLEKLNNKWKELAKNAERPLSGLRNQCDQLRLVSSEEVDNAELCSFEGLKEKLVFKINVGIEDEVALLLDFIAQLNNANQELKNKLRQLEISRDKVDLRKPEMEELVQGTPYRPRLNLLMEWAIDGYEYYHDLYPLSFSQIINMQPIRRHNLTKNPEGCIIQAWEECFPEDWIQILQHESFDEKFGLHERRNNHEFYRVICRRQVQAGPHRPNIILVLLFTKDWIKKFPMNGNTKIFFLSHCFDMSYICPRVHNYHASPYNQAKRQCDKNRDGTKSYECSTG